MVYIEYNTVYCMSQITNKIYHILMCAVVGLKHGYIKSKNTETVTNIVFGHIYVEYSILEL